MNTGMQDQMRVSYSCKLLLSRATEENERSIERGQASQDRREVRPVECLFELPPKFFRLQANKVKAAGRPSRKGVGVGRRLEEEAKDGRGCVRPLQFWSGEKRSR